MSDVGEKIARFAKLKAQYPKMETVRFSLASAYEEAEAYDDAIREFEELVAMKEDFCVAYLHLGSCLMEEERFDEAIRALEKGRELAVAQSHEAPRMEADMLLEAAREELDA